MVTIIRVTNPLQPSEGTERRTLDGWQHTLDELMRDDWELRFAPAPKEGYETWARNVTVSLNGHVWGRSMWTEITPPECSTIVIVPGVAGGSLLRTLASIAIMAAAVVTTVLTAGAGVALFGLTVAMTSALLGGAVSIAGSLILSAFGSSQPSNKGTSASYDPDGPRSLAQSGVVIPKGNGTFRWGGNIISSFTDLAGSDQYINVLVCFGFGPARALSSIQINGKDISSYQNVQYYVRLGTNSQTEISNFNRIVNGSPQDTQCLAGVPVVVPGTGDLTQALQVDIQFPDGIFVNTNDGNIIPAVITYLVEYSLHGSGVWLPVLQPRTTASIYDYHLDGSAYLPYAWGAVATDLPPSSGVVYALDNGPHNPGDPYTATETVTTYQPNGNHATSSHTVQGEWQLLDLNMNYVDVIDWTAGYQDFVAAQTTPCYNRTQILGLAPGIYDVRITKYGCTRLHDNVPFGDNWSPTIGQDMWVHSVNEIALLDLAYPNLILLGIRALATSQLNGSSLNVTALVQHGLRSVDTGVMPAALLAFEEDNPACVSADMMLDDLYGGGAGAGGPGFAGIAAANLERYIDEWIAWAELNDTLVPDGNGNSIRLHVFNGVFDNESNLWEQLGVVTAMSRAAIVPLGLDYGVATDQAVAAPVQMFTVGNILQDSFSEIWLQLADRSNQIEVQFADSTRSYKEDNPLVYMDPAQQDAGVIIKNTRIRGKGITIPAQAWHFARFKQRSTEFLLRSGSFKTDTDGIACRPFNVIALQHDVPQWGFGGRTLPGSTTTRLLLDRDDIPFVGGTSYSVMVQHAAVQRYAGTVSSVSTTSGAWVLTLSAFDNVNRVTRAVLNGEDCVITASNVNQITVTPATGFTPAGGQSFALFDTDVLETVAVSGIDPVTGALVLATPLEQTPDDYALYIYGVSGAVKWVRVMQIRRASELRSTIDWIDYDADCYDIGTPLIGETSAVVVTNPGVTNLTGTEIFQWVLGSNVSFASLSWQNGPDTAGVAIYASYGAGGLPQMVARLPGAPTTWQAQQVPLTTVTYYVVGYDVNDTYAAFTTAPKVTIEAVGIAANLLLGSNFASGFTFWNLAQRGGDTLTWDDGNDGEAFYTVAGAALTAAAGFLFQVVQPSKWAVGDVLMLSAYVEDSCLVSTAPNVGNVVLAIFFNNSAGATISTQTVSCPLSGIQPTLTRFNTAPVTIPVGTVQVVVAASFAGSGLSIPVGSIVTLSHFLLEIPAVGQTVPSFWADIDARGQIDDLFTTGSSTGLRVQGSTLPTFTGSVTYLSGPSSNTIYIAWTNIVILWPDGGITYVQNGSVYTWGLSSTSGTIYWAFLYFDVVNGGIKLATPTTPAGTASILTLPGIPITTVTLPQTILSAAYDPFADAFCKQDGRVPLTPGGYQVAIDGSPSTYGRAFGAPITSPVPAF